MVSQTQPTDDVRTETTSNGSDVVPTTLSDFVTTTLIETTDDGEVIYPDAVAGYGMLRQQYDTETVFASPIGVDEVDGRMDEQLFMVGITSPVGKDRYEVIVEIGRKFDGYRSPGVMATGETEREAAEHAVEWMQEHTAPDVPSIYRPGDVDRQRMDTRMTGKQVDRIREGSRVYVDSLPPAQVVQELDTSDLAVSGGTVWEVETMNQSSETFHLFDEPGYNTPVSYAGSLADYASRTRVEHLTVDNEQNLRDCINRPLYQWLKDRQSETVIRQTGDHSLKVRTVENLRDGHLNPTSDEGLDPTSHHPSGTVIGEDTDVDNWFDNEIDLPTGEYHIRANGVVEPHDTYATNPLVSADEWDAFGAFGPTDEATETTTTLSNPLPADRSGLSRDDDITEITGIGPATADDMWHETVGELYDAGFPAAFAPNQYLDKIIADLYTLAETPTANTAARAVVGVLGGVGYDTDGESIGTAASMITDSVDADELQAGWLGHQRLKDELTPAWMTNDEDGPTALGAGRITASDIEQAVDGPIGDKKPVTELRKAAVGHDGKVALSTDDGNYVEISEAVLQTAATVAGVDLSEMGENGNHVSIYAGENRRTGEGVVFVSSTSRPFNAIVDTDGFVDERELFTSTS